MFGPASPPVCFERHCTLKGSAGSGADRSGRAQGTVMSGNGFLLVCMVENVIIPIPEHPCSEAEERCQGPSVPMLSIFLSSFPFNCSETGSQGFSPQKNTSQYYR